MKNAGQFSGEPIVFVQNSLMKMRLHVQNRNALINKY
jgi:hypothetical protein